MVYGSSTVRSGQSHMRLSPDPSNISSFLQTFVRDPLARPCAFLPGHIKTVNEWPLRSRDRIRRPVEDEWEAVFPDHCVQVMITTPVVPARHISLTRSSSFFSRHHILVQGGCLNYSSSPRRHDKVLLAHFEKTPHAYRNVDNEHTSPRPLRRLLVENNTAALRLKPNYNDQLKERTGPRNTSASVREDKNQWLSATLCYSIHYGRGGLRPDPCSTSPTTRWRISGPSTEERHDIRNWKLSPTSFSVAWRKLAMC